ncbi:MAG: HAMP domain-containing histidine kinase [Bradyrhizobium sp.]|nr:MAG: HAMP domain-containing histidine kinase [Bradyrhizobium sp.]
MSLLSPDQATPNPTPSLVGAPDGAAAAPESGVSARVALGGRSIGVAGRLLMLTIGFVLLAMGLFYASRLAAYRENWLRDRLMVAHSAMMLFGETGEETVPHELAGKILDTVGAKSIIVALPDGRRLVAATGAAPANAPETVEIGEPSLLMASQSAFRTMFAAPGTLTRVVGKLPSDGALVDVTLDETPLIDAMWRISRNFLNLSLLISAVVTFVLWAALWWLVIRPVRRLTSSIIAFGERPQEHVRIRAPSGRVDEIGRAEVALAAMQGSLAHELRQRKRLSELGMAVARINHDLRNMLSAAQLISDRLASIPDPLAQRLAPRLVATLDRAILFCQSTLTYGGGREQAAAPREFDLRELVRQIVETAEAERSGAVVYAIDIPPKFELLADPDHISRVIENLCRNAAQVLVSRGAQNGRPTAIRLAAIRTGAVALIEISDTGPGFAPDQAAHIFEPFHLTTRQGGTGLGLAIAADLVARNAGSISLAEAKSEDFYCGARFLITLPTPEVAGRRNARIVAPN